MELEELKQKLNALREGDNPPTADAGSGEGIDTGATLGTEGAPMPIGGAPMDAGGVAPMPAAPMAAAPYLTQENFNTDFGQWFNNDANIGAALFQQMSAMGVDTKSATEAALRNVLEDVVNRSRALMQQLSFFISNFMQQTNQMAAMSAAVNNALAMNGEPIPQVNVGNPPPEEPAMGMGGEEPPPPPSEGGGEMPPEGEGGGELPPPPPEGGGEEPPPPPPPEETPSDSRVKNVQSPKYVVSDAQAKNIYRNLHNSTQAQNKATTRRRGILDAISKGL